MEKEEQEKKEGVSVWLPAQPSLRLPGALVVQVQPSAGWSLSGRGRSLRSPTNSWAFIVGGVIGVNRQMPVRNHAPGTAVEKAPGIGLPGRGEVGSGFQLVECLPRMREV